MTPRYLLLCLAFALSVTTTSIAQSPIKPGNRVAIIGNTFADQLRMHGYLETLLLQHTQNDPITIRNLGWAGDMVSGRDRPTGFPSEESALIAHKTDVILACFGMGESFAGKQGLEEFKSGLNQIIASHAGKKYNGTTAVRLVLVSPIACENLGKLTPGVEKRNQDLQAYTLAMREVASEADVPLVDLYQASRYLMDEDIGPNLTGNGIHLNEYGYWAISHAFFDQLSGGRIANKPSWLLSIDASAKSSDARSARISSLQFDDSGIRFLVTEETPPTLAPPISEPLPPQLAFVRDTLVVENLSPGTYRLSVDGKVIASAGANAWSDGVAIDSSPAHQAYESYRQTVNDKNLQFTYSWKALNQVHIVGERRSSPSGKALPKEIIEFSKLASDLDIELHRGIELKTRKWQLSRVKD